MNYNELNQLGKEVTFLIKNATWFPYKSGHLRSDATDGRMFNQSTFRIHFDSSIAEYIPYLEEGTKPHDIPHAFGFGTLKPDRANPYTGVIPFGVGGRFDGKFHPGSTKHKGFIKDKAVMTIVNYICAKYEGVATSV